MSLVGDEGDDYDWSLALLVFMPESADEVRGLSYTAIRKYIQCLPSRWQRFILLDLE